MTYQAFRITELFYVSAIIFPVDFRERCAKLPARNGKKFGKLSAFDMKKGLNRPFFTRCSTESILAGVAGFEPTNDGVRGKLLFQKSAVFARF